MGEHWKLLEDAVWAEARKHMSSDESTGDGGEPQVWSNSWYEKRWVLTAAGMPCYFPFEWDGQLYDDCQPNTMVHDGRGYCCVDAKCRLWSICTDWDPLYLTHWKPMPQFFPRDRLTDECTLTGVDAEFQWSPSTSDDTDTVFIIDDPDSMWSTYSLHDDEVDLSPLVTLAMHHPCQRDDDKRCFPTQLVWISYFAKESKVERSLSRLKSRLQAALENATKLHPHRSANLINNFYFVTTPAWHIEISKCWLIGVLHDWSHLRNMLTISNTSIKKRSTCGVEGSWAPNVPGREFPESLPLKWFGAGCGSGEVSDHYGTFNASAWPSPAASVEGAAAVVMPGDCSYFMKAKAAQEAGAAAVILIEESTHCREIRCAQPDPCKTTKLTILMVAVGKDEGKIIMDRLVSKDEVSASIGRKRHGPNFIGARGDHLHKFGYIGKGLSDVVLEVRGMYRERRLAENRSALQARSDSQGESADAELWQVWSEQTNFHDLRSTWSVKDAERVVKRQYNSLQVEFWLDCRSHLDMECEKWDREIRVYLTPLSSAPELNQDFLLAMFVTPYQREARWLVNATSALPLLREGAYSGQDWNFYIPDTYLFNGYYNMSMALWLQTLPCSTERGEIIGDLHLTRKPLFGDRWPTAFPNAWKETRPISFEVPNGADTAVLSVLITGHGGDENKEGCAEFCPLSHHFTLDNNAKDVIVNHSFAGEDGYCENQVDEGVVPNQFGSWEDGRGGWCPGAQVPWREVDVTHLLLPGTNVLHNISVRTLYKGAEYVPTLKKRWSHGRNTELWVSSVITFYKKPGECSEVEGTQPWCGMGTNLGCNALAAAICLAVFSCILAAVLAVRRSIARNRSLETHKMGLHASSSVSGMLELAYIDNQMAKPE